MIRVCQESDIHGCNGGAGSQVHDAHRSVIHDTIGWLPFFGAGDGPGVHEDPVLLLFQCPDMGMSLDDDLCIRGDPARVVAMVKEDFLVFCGKCEGMVMPWKK